MACDNAPPARKKSRFFSNGKNKIGSLLTRNKKLDHNEDKACTSESDTDDEPSTSSRNTDQHVSAARAVNFKSIGSGRDVNSTERGSHGEGMNTNDRDKSQSTLVLGNRRLEAVYGPQNIGGATFETSPSSSLFSSFSSTCSSSTFGSTRRAVTPFISQAHQDRQSASTNRQTSPQHRSLHTLEGQQNHYGTRSTSTSTAPQQSFQSDHVQISFDPLAGVVNMGSTTSNGAVYANLSAPRALPYQPQAQSSRALRENECSLGSARLCGTVNEAAKPNRVGTSRNTCVSNKDVEFSNSSTFVARDNHNVSAQSVSQHTRLIARPIFTDHTTRASVADEQGAAAPASDMSPKSLAENTSLDLDRDTNGNLLAPHLRRFAIQEPWCPPEVCRSDQSSSTTPANLYSSPKRMARAIELSSRNLKRKRSAPNSPPPSYIYVRSNDPSFNIFANGFLLYPELCLALASHLPLRDLVSLYAISKDFHTIVDSRFTTVCLTQAIRKAPESAQTFSFRTYSQYCRDDPALRLPHPDPTKAAKKIARLIPSFRWVTFVLHREKVVHELIAVFAERGCPLPARCSLALKRMWILMDIPDNARRIALVHNHRIYTDLDLYFMMCFFVKLDMLANDPVAAEKRDGFRKILLSQKGGLDVVLKVLKREMWQKKADFLLAWVKDSMNLDNIGQEQLDRMACNSVFGVPVEEVGIGKYEYWGTRGVINENTGNKRRYLLRPDQLVMREAVRRGLRFDRHFMRCILYGYVRPDTLESYAPRKYGRRIGEWVDEDYDIDDSVGGVRALSVEDGGDPLLDLGNKSRGSRYTIAKEPVSRTERMMREGQNRLLHRLYQISEAEERQQA